MKKFISVIIGSILLIIGLLIGLNINKTDAYEEENVVPEVTHKNMLSMMLEQNAGAGDYSLETRSSWPTKDDGYIFNSTLSKCENGSQLRWDDENNAVVMVGTTSDKCYVYFDVYVEPPYHESCNDNTLACYVAKQYTGTQGENNLYYHDSMLANGANDNSYRYAGSSATTNNYVCFGSDADTCPNDNLYRIIGVFDGRVRLIKADYATTTSLGTDTSDYYDTYSGMGWSTSNYKGSQDTSTIGLYYWNYANYSASNTATGYYNDWSYSKLNKTHLNKNYLANIGEEWKSMIDTTKWKAGGNTAADMYQSNAQTAYTNEITSPSSQVTKTYESKIGLMYVSDYYYGASPTYWTYPGYSSSGGSYDYRASIGENWMYMGLEEWTMVRSSSNSRVAFFIYDTGYIYNGDLGYSTGGVRPVFHLTSKVEVISGDGTKSNPLKIRLGN